MREVVKKILRDSNVSEDVCEILLADYMRLFFEVSSTSNTQRGIVFLTSDSKKQEGIKYAIRAVSYSIPKMLEPSVLERIFQIGRDFSKTDITPERVIDIDNFDVAREDENLKTRISSTQVSLGLKSASLQREIAGLEEEKESTTIYEVRAERYKTQVSEAENDVANLEERDTLWSLLKLGKAKRTLDEWEFLYQSNEKKLGEIRNKNKAIDIQIQPKKLGVSNISAKTEILQQGKDGLVGFYDRVTERTPRISVVNPKRTPIKSAELGK